MTTSEQILVIILSVFLAIFLILGIIALFWAVKIFRSFKRIMDKAESIADKAENIADFFQKTAPSVAFGRFISNITDSVFHNKRKTNKKDKYE